ncbi:MAG: CDP-glycerol glycerophosphotransferase family protein [Eubacterium sp.]|nr:CDP-glycerol glycerophosphotransferase family protein [Eubacterium sp.]
MADGKFVLKQRLKMFMQKAVLPAAYRLGCIRKVNENLIVFADAHHDIRPVSMDRLAEELISKKEYKIIERYHDYASMGFVGQFFDSVKFMWLYAKTGCVIICDNYMPVAACKKRKKTKVIQLWHGPGAYKKFGYDSADDIPDYYKGNVFKNYDLVTVSGEKCIAPFSSAMRQPDGIVKAVGISRMDGYREEKNIKKCHAIFEKKYPEAAGKKTILWAPSFRGNAGEPRLLGLEAIDKLKEKLGDKWCVICSIHPHLYAKYDREDLRGRIPTEQIIPCVDIFITDYSSVLYDACIYEKKMLMFAPDLDEFVKARGTYMTMDEFPGEIVTDENKLSEAVIRTYDEYDYDKQKEFVRGYLAACDGHATERIVEFIRKNV